MPSPRVLVCTALAGAVLLVGLSIIRAERRLATLKSALTKSTEASKTAELVPDHDSNEREAILSMIRDHQRQADEAWRRNIAETIYEESVAADVDPLMTACIIASESSFRTTVVSSAGAVGLMQLRPFVAEDVARRRAINWSGIETLHKPRLNVRLGVLYYKELMQRFEGDTRVALTAYNYGPTRVRRQLRTGTYSGSRYAETILARYDRLRTRQL